MAWRGLKQTVCGDLHSNRLECYAGVAASLAMNRIHYFHYFQGQLTSSDQSRQFSRGHDCLGSDESGATRPHETSVFAGSPSRHALCGAWVEAQSKLAAFTE